MTALDYIASVTATVEPGNTNIGASLLRWLRPTLKVGYKRHGCAGIEHGPIELKFQEYKTDHQVLSVELYVAGTLLYAREFHGKYIPDMYKSAPMHQTIAQRSVDKIGADFNSLSLCQTDAELAKLAYDKSTGRTPSQWLAAISEWRKKNSSAVATVEPAMSVEDTLRAYNINTAKAVIRNNRLIEFHGNIYLAYTLQSGIIPKCFHTAKVYGFFDVSGNKLRSLDGSPQEVFGNFLCEHNQLKSLRGAPKLVHGDFKCGYNYITSFEGCGRVLRGLLCEYNVDMPANIKKPESVEGPLIK